MKDQLEPAVWTPDRSDSLSAVSFLATNEKCLNSLNGWDSEKP